MSKPRAVVRQWTLLRVLSQHKEGLSISEMSQHMSVNERTIRRDINLFVQAGVPLRETVGRRGKKAWRVDARTSVAVPVLSVDEVLSLFVAEQLLAPLRGTRLHSATKRCRDKITAALSSSDHEVLEQHLSVLKNSWNDQFVLPPGLTAIESLFDGD